MMTPIEREDPERSSLTSGGGVMHARALDPRSHGPPWGCRQGRSASLMLGSFAEPRPATRSVEVGIPTQSVGTVGAGELGFRGKGSRSGLHGDRVVRRDPHHLGADLAAPALHPVLARERPANPVREEPDADRRGPGQLLVHPQGFSSGRGQRHRARSRTCRSATTSAGPCRFCPTSSRLPYIASSTSSRACTRMRT